jgi:uncharacterized protein
MTTIRDLVSSLRQRESVTAAVVLGRDGLLIDGAAAPTLDLEHLAAHVPAIIATADEFAAIAGRGPLRTGILELVDAVAVVSVLSEEAVLVVLVEPTDAVGPILLELRRNHAHLASLV